MPTGQGFILTRALAWIVERVRRRPVLGDEAASKWEHALDALTAEAFALGQTVGASEATRAADRDRARETVEQYKAVAKELEADLGSDVIAQRLLAATVRAADELVKAADWLTDNPPGPPEGLAATWEEFATVAHFAQYVTREYLPLARMSGAERLTRAAWRERLWLSPADIERTYLQVARAAAAPKMLPDGSVLVMLPPFTDRRTTIERYKDGLRHGRRERLKAQVSPPPPPDPS